ncbi:hypothetical protein BU25DRAFT_481740 [Macroventuria anomochaeta]|uniref:Uncharacterized protein n=1 Tax=Macroventuria anomochaeta TaxID=301207 RepID=A0ACB6SB31_9PLEO|nr:uncharacterized protein BU25DRAFT_481740 [Macroventuria anomochaeta]KAF2631187.1 hypothetical protein BU25DRAFT_481740 [Macroventuria anomochaeta]
MPQEADFCGDRLRLSAFLRVVGDGMPQRPTRFRRRLRAVDNGVDTSIYHGTDRADHEVPPAERVAREGPSSDVSIFDIARSLSPDQPTLAPTDLLPEVPTNSERHVFAAPVAAADPIEDSQMLTIAPFRSPSRQPVAHRVQKPSPARAAISGSPMWILRRQLGHPHSTKFDGARSRTLPQSSFATGSDGFVGAELSIQHTNRPTKAQISNKTRMKKTVPDRGGLVMICGHLPAPPVEHHEGVLAVAEHPMHTGDRAPVHPSTRVVERWPLSQRAITEIRKALSERNARERRNSSPRQQEALVRDQLSNVTAPIRRVSEGSSSAPSDEECIPNNELDSDNDDDNAHDDSRSPHTFPSGRIRSSIADTKYFESAMHNLDAAEGSGNMNLEIRSQYAGIVRSDGYWFPEGGATGMVHSI